MEFLNYLSQYIQKVLHVSIKIHRWPKQKELPFFLTDLYHFYLMEVKDWQSLLMIAKADTKSTPAEIKKQMNLVEKKWKGPCIYASEKISSYNRDRLITSQIPFIIPGNQMCLPDLGLDLRERFIQQKEKTKKNLTPATQVVLIHVLLGHENRRFFTVELADKLNYTVMTINRTFDELKAGAIGEVLWQGKERYWTFSGTRKELWRLTKAHMRDPVKKRVWVPDIKPFKKKCPMAGSSALAHYSMLNPPSLPIYALKDIDLTEVLPSSEEAKGEIEIWRYHPNLFQQEGIVDPFSLYLSLETEALKDERIGIALDEMLEKYL